MFLVEPSSNLRSRLESILDESGVDLASSADTSSVGGLRSRLSSILDSSGFDNASSLAQADRDRRAPLEEAQRFNLKKVPQAATVGTLGLAADTVVGAGVQLQGFQSQADRLRSENIFSAKDQGSTGARRAFLRQVLQTGEIPVEMEFEPAPAPMIGPMSLVDPSPIDPSMVQPFEPETDRARGGDTIPLGPPRKPRFRKITPDERKAFTKELQDQEILPAAVKLAGSISKVAQDIGYVPSTGFVSSVVEGALQSAPHFLGGVALTAAGGTVAGPVGAFAASAGYFGATEGASHTADTYRKLIDSGVDQMTALDTASAEGALYGAASGLLEFAGVETVLQSKRFAKSLEKVVGSSKWQQAGASVLLAGSGEGTTEVLQGVVGESLQAYATDNWDDFKTKYSNSTEPAQEFLSAFLLGGTVRGGIEVLDPTNYDSLFEYREASGADAGDIPADRAMIGADGKVTFISDAQRAEMGPSPTPKSDAAQRVADAIGAGETPSPEDLRLAADSVPAGGSGRGNGAVGRIVNGAADDTLDPPSSLANRGDSGRDGVRAGPGAHDRPDESGGPIAD